MPYFYAISKSSDLTFTPRIFSENEYLLRSEYRKITKNSSSIADLSINEDNEYSTNGRKTHFFKPSFINLDSIMFNGYAFQIELKFKAFKKEFKILPRRQ